MKNLSKVYLSAFIFVCAFLFASCDFFAGGSLLKNSIDDSIKRQKTPKVTVTNVSPSFSSEGVPKDSSINIFFSESLSTENDFSDIKITNNGEDLKSYFNNPVLNGNLLTYAAKSDEYIPVTNGKTVTIEVKIPARYYVGESVEELLQLEDYVSTYRINNSTNTKAEVTFSVSADKGTISPVGTQKYSIGESFNISFEPSAGYNFGGWNILDGEGNPVDESILLVENKNALTTKITVLKSATGISIVPISLLIPDGVYFPSLELSGVPQDTSLTVTFNTPMSLESFFDSSKNKFKNISIYTGSTSLLPDENQFLYFKKPEISEDGLVLTIPTNKANPIIQDAGATKDINVVIKTKNLVSLENLTFEKNIEWTYRINSNLDKEKPSEVQANIFKHEDYKNQLNSAVFSDDWDETILKQNHVGKKLYIKASGYDAGGGVSQVKVKETWIRNENGGAVTSETVTKLYSTVSFTTDSTGNIYSTAFVHDFINTNDGVIKIEISLLDYAGNESDVVTYYAVKDTVIDVMNIAPKEEGHEIKEKVYSENFYYDRKGNKCLRYAVINDEFIREVDGQDDILTFDCTNLTEIFYNNKTTEILIKELLFGYSDNETTMEKADVDSTGKIFTLKRDKTKNTYLIFKAIDEAQNETSLLRIIPQNVNPIGIDAQESFSKPISIYKSIKTSDQNSFNNFGEDSGLYYVFKYASEDGYKVFADIEKNEPDLMNGRFTFNPCNYGYYSSGDGINYRRIDCHTGIVLRKVLATQEDYLNYMAVGSYYVYVIPYIKYAERTYFGARSTPLKVEVTNSGTTVSVKPNSLSDETYNVSPNRYICTPARGTLPESDVFPVNKEDVVYSCVPGPKGSGKYIISVDYAKPKQNLNYSLEIFVMKYDEGYERTSIIYSSGDTISVDTGYRYNVYLYATDSEGHYYSSTFCKWEAKCKEIDNISPVWTFDDIYNSDINVITETANYTISNGFRLFKVNGYVRNTLLPKDSSELKKDEKGNVLIDYYYIYLGNEKTPPRDFSEEELTRYEKHTTSYNPTESTDLNFQCLIPYDGLEEGYYELYMVAEDIYGNRGSSYGVICTKIQDVDLTYSYEEGKSPYGKLIFNATQDLKKVICEYFSVENQKWGEKIAPTLSLADGTPYTWGYLGSYYAYYHSLNVYDSVTTGSVTYNTTTPGFIKLNINNNGSCSYTKYVFPDYYNSANKANYPCLKKDFMVSSSTVPMITIWCDAPTLVHTFCCSKNLTEGEDLEDSENAAKIWYSKGIEVTEDDAIMQKSSDFSYKIPVKSDTIKKGMWYTTIIHFADGTTLMTEPKQK